MPDQLQLRGGTTTEHNSFTGALREVTVDTTKKTLVVHDGSQAGGTPLMKESGGNAASTVGIGVGGANKITINADGHVDIASNLDCAAGIDVTGNITSTGTTTTSKITINSTSPTIELGESDGNPDYRLISEGGTFFIQDQQSGPATRFQINSDGHVDIEHHLDVGNGLDVTGAITATGNLTMGEQLEISATSPNILFTDSNHNPDYRVKVDNGAFTIEDAADNSDKFVINSSGNIGIGTSTPAQLFHVDGQARVGTLGVGQNAGSSTLGVNGNISISPSGNTSYQKFSIDGSQVTTGSALTINNYGDVEGDYHNIGVNATLNASGNIVKTNTAKRSMAVILDGRIGQLGLYHSQTSTSTVDHLFNFDRSGHFSLLSGNVVLSNNAGIDFSASGGTGTSGASTTSSLLDDYELGTWTPVVAQGIDGGAAYAIQRGWYCRIGACVSISFFIRFVTSNTGSTGNGNHFIVGGIPYSSANLSPSYNSGGFVPFTSVNFNGSSQVMLYIGNNSSNIEFYQGRNGVASVSGGNSGKDLYGNMTYRIG